MCCQTPVSEFTKTLFRFDGHALGVAERVQRLSGSFLRTNPTGGSNQSKAFYFDEKVFEFTPRKIVSMEPNGESRALQEANSITFAWP